MRAVAALAAVVGVVAVAAPAYAAAEIGATIESRVYMDERATMMILSRSTVPATFSFEPSGGWQVEPMSLTLDPDEQAEVRIVGNGEDGAAIAIRVTAADPEPGMLAGAGLLTARVYYQRPLDPLPILVAGLFMALIVSSAIVWQMRRRKGARL